MGGGGRGGFNLLNHYKTQNLKHFGGGGVDALGGEYSETSPDMKNEMCFLFAKSKLLVNTFVMTTSKISLSKVRAVGHIWHTRLFYPGRERLQISDEMRQLD